MKIIIVFGSEMGTTRYVAKVAQEQLTSKGHEVKLYEARKDGLSPDLTGYDIVLFGSPTYFEGLLESNMQDLVDEFKPELSSYKVGVFSLGSHDFNNFCGSAEILEDWVAKHGGTLALPTIKIDGYPNDLSQISEWIEQINNLT
jgi:flavodoxin